MSSEGDPVLSLLGTKKVWKSEELQKLLEQQLERRSLLLQKKDAVEADAARILAEGRREVKGDLQETYAFFLRLKALQKKLILDKLPSRVESLHFYHGMERAEEIENVVAYLTILHFFVSSSEQIEANLESHLESDAIQLFTHLKWISTTYFTVSDYENLAKFGTGIVSFWERKLTAKLVKDLEQQLEAFGWPMRLKTATPSIETHEKLHKTVVNLTKVVASDDDDENEGEANLEKYNKDFSPILPVQVLMAPIKRRFRFHFLSDKPTSESSRPEWYFSQVKQWLYDLVPFVKIHLEQVTLTVRVSSVTEFIRCVSEMLIAKVHAHLNDDSRDAVFIKILEEAILFENEIGDYVAETVENPGSSYLPPFVNAIFSQTEMLRRWLDAERKASLNKLDDLFSSPSAWNKPVVSAPPEIVDLFVAVIRSLSDRFAHLQKPKNRVAFLYLLKDLLEEFHVRCSQTWKSKSEFEDYLSKDVVVDYIIADALYSITETLQEWEYLPFFASLPFNTDEQDESKSHDYTENRNSFREDEADLKLNETGTGHFATEIELFQCLAAEIQYKWCSKIGKRVKDELGPYSRLKWQSMENSTVNVSEQLLRPLQTIKDVVKAMSTSMDRQNVEKWLKKLAVRIDEVLMEVVVFPCRFSRPAVTQFATDLQSAVFPIFADYGLNDTLFFGSTNSALIILQLSTGEAMLLYDTLMNGNFDSHELALAEINVSICQSEAIKILRNRCDLRL